MLKRRWKQRERLKNNNFARAAHFFIVHFFAVVSPFVRVAMQYIYILSFIMFLFID